MDEQRLREIEWRARGHMHLRHEARRAVEELTAEVRRLQAVEARLREGLTLLIANIDTCGLAVDPAYRAAAIAALEETDDHG